MEFAVLIRFVGAVAGVVAAVAAADVAAAVAAVAVAVGRSIGHLILRLAKACSLEMILSRELAVWILLIVSVYISENQTNNFFIVRASALCY